MTLYAVFKKQPEIVFPKEKELAEEPAGEETLATADGIPVHLSVFITVAVVIAVALAGGILAYVLAKRKNDAEKSNGE